MFIQFAYVQKKTTNENFVVIYKENIDIINVYKLSYESLYHQNYNENINIYDHIYIKKGLKIEYKQEIWNILVKSNMKTLNLINLIDDIHLLAIYNSNHLIFNYDDNKEILKNILINTFFEHYIYK